MEMRTCKVTRKINKIQRMNEPKSIQIKVPYYLAKQGFMIRPKANTSHITYLGITDLQTP